VLLLQTTYSGPAEEFSWIIPVPGLPDEGDVFLASQHFLDEAFSASKPATKVTFLSEQGHIARQVGRDGDEGTLPPGGETAAGEEGAAADVTVHSRSVVGEYEATVLSTPAGQVLIDWLQGNGFHIPDDAAPIIEQYAAKNWYFVALRVSPAIAKVKRIMQDAPPIGIEFATDELVFPLSISRVSAPEWQRVDLVVVGPQPRTAPASSASARARRQRSTMTCPSGRTNGEAPASCRWTVCGPPRSLRSSGKMISRTSR
jgi:hypothetical protein